jgi:biopolymer transport protein ExbB
MAQKDRSTSGASALLILAVILSFAMAISSSRGIAAASPAAAETVAGAGDSLDNPKSETLSAKGTDDARERERLDRVSTIRHGGLGDWYVRGGVFMHPLLACAIAGAAFIVERIHTLNRARVDTKKLMDRLFQALRIEGVDAGLRVCEETRGPVAAVLHAGLMRANEGPEVVREAAETAGAIEESFLGRRLVVIATVSSIAPMIGFLGTVWGVRNALVAVAAAGQANAAMVAAGIGEALITAIAGLCIAIPCAIAHSYCVGSIDRFVLEMEEASSNLVNEIVRIGAK